MDEGRVDGSGGGKRSGRVGGWELAQSIRGFDEVYERPGHCEAGAEHRDEAPTSGLCARPPGPTTPPCESTANEFAVVAALSFCTGVTAVKLLGCACTPPRFSLRLSPLSARSM
jgi:hypothetical protein